LTDEQQASTVSKNEETKSETTVVVLTEPITLSPIEEKVEEKETGNLL
jgi:hypothetical protein